MVLSEVNTDCLPRYAIEPQQVFGFMENLGYSYLAVTKERIWTGTTWEEDIKEAANFLFYCGKHNPVF